jgi:Putative beta-barrel porin-2, OmpL-like. bbp2
MKGHFTICCLLFCLGVEAQTDSVVKKGKLTLEGYVDVYYSYAFSHPPGGTRPYWVSYDRDNEINVDMAYVRVQYTSDRVRAIFTPGFGTYMNANYAVERQTLQNIVEASVGIRLFKNKEIWLDGGVFDAPYTYENTFSLDQLAYTRSLGADNTPYYLTGAKLTVPLDAKWTAYLYLLNGWQVIESQHDPLDFGSQLEYKPNDQLDINWNTYIGDESSIQNPGYRSRIFEDVEATYNPTSKWSLAADGHSGWQRRYENGGSLQSVSLQTRQWWNLSATARYQFLARHSITLRLEHFDDPYQVLVKPVTPAPGYKVTSASAGYNLSVTDEAMIRFEGRYFVSPYGLWPLRNQTDADNDTWLTIGLTARFK